MNGCSHPFSAGSIHQRVLGFDLWVILFVVLIVACSSQLTFVPFVRHSNTQHDPDTSVPCLCDNVPRRPRPRARMRMERLAWPRPSARAPEILHHTPLSCLDQTAYYPVPCSPDMARSPSQALRTEQAHRKRAQTATKKSRFTGTCSCRGSVLPDALLHLCST